MNVVIKLSGGLGNQLFQYAAGHRLALVHGRPLVLDQQWYAQVPAGSAPRSVLLSELRIVASFANSAGDPASLAEGAPRANMTCDTYPREISEQRGRYDDQPPVEGPDARSEEFIRSARVARSPQGD